jgi:predicted secreted protein
MELQAPDQEATAAVGPREVLARERASDAGPSGDADADALAASTADAVDASGGEALLPQSASASSTSKQLSPLLTTVVSALLFVGLYASVSKSQGLLQPIPNYTTLEYFYTISNVGAILATAASWVVLEGAGALGASERVVTRRRWRRAARPSPLELVAILISPLYYLVLIVMGIHLSRCNLRPNPNPNPNPPRSTTWSSS